MADAELRCEGLTFAYPGGEPVLLDATFTVAPGRSVGLLGPNGAGKSTLLGALVGCLEGRRTGTVALGDGPRPSPRQIGYASQDVALYQLLSIRECLHQMAVLLLGRAAAPEAVEAALHEFGLEHLADTRCSRLSGGQARMAHLAVSFVHRPRVRILDEPTTGLDFGSRERLVALVSAWRAAGDALLVTGHYPEDIEDMCDDIVIVAEGRTLSLGPLTQLLAAAPAVLSVRPSDDDAWLRAELGDTRAATVTDEIGRLVAPDRSLGDVRFESRSLRTMLRSDPTLAAMAELGGSAGVATTPAPDGAR